MNAYTSPRELDLLPANRMSNPVARRPAPRRSIGDLAIGLFARLAEAMHRRSIISELSDLSDRELADIGLTRAEVRHVFDRSFARA